MKFTLESIIASGLSFDEIYDILYGKKEGVTEFQIKCAKRAIREMEDEEIAEWEHYKFSRAGHE